MFYMLEFYWYWKASCSQERRLFSWQIRHCINADIVGSEIFCKKAGRIPISENSVRVFCEFPRNKGHLTGLLQHPISLTQWVYQIRRIHKWKKSFLYFWPSAYWQASSPLPLLHRTPKHPKCLCWPSATSIRNPKQLYADLEAEMLEAVNRLGIGPQGFGGTVTALAVNIEQAPTHIAGLPVSVNIGCHVTRHASAILWVYHWFSLK